MQQQPHRMMLCAKDIMAITGKSERTARRIMAAIKKQHPGTTVFGITIFHFSLFTGIQPEAFKEWM